MLIVGAGSTGALGAQRMAAQGLSVVVLEAGQRFERNNALTNSEANAGKIRWSEPRNHIGNDFVIPQAGMGGGGGTQTWLGVMPRFHREDFCTHSTEGVGANEKAQTLAGGKAGTGALADGFFVEPTVFSGVHNQMRIAQEEIFGSVVCASPFAALPDAIAKGNDSHFDLAAGLWPRDIRKAHQAAAALEAGTVWVNCYNTFANASPWGGFKQSGWGREKGP